MESLHYPELDYVYARSLRYNWFQSQLHSFMAHKILLMLVPDIHGEMPSAIMNGQKGPESLLQKEENVQKWFSAYY